MFPFPISALICTLLAFDYPIHPLLYAVIKTDTLRFV